MPAAKVAGVSNDKLVEAETMLAQTSEEQAASAEAAKLATYDKELKDAAGLSGLFGSSEVTDVARLEAAVNSAREAGVTSEALGKAEAKLAAIRIDAEKKRSFQRAELTELRQVLGESSSNAAASLPPTVASPLAH